MTFTPAETNIEMDTEPQLEPFLLNPRNRGFFQDKTRYIDAYWRNWKGAIFSGAIVIVFVLGVAYFFPNRTIIGSDLTFDLMVLIALAVAVVIAGVSVFMLTKSRYTHRLSLEGKTILGELTEIHANILRVEGGGAVVSSVTASYSYS